MTAFEKLQELWRTPLVTKTATAIDAYRQVTIDDADDDVLRAAFNGSALDDRLVAVTLVLKRAILLKPQEFWQQIDPGVTAAAQKVFSVNMSYPADGLQRPDPECLGKWMRDIAFSHNPLATRYMVAFFNSEAEKFAATFTEDVETIEDNAMYMIDATEAMIENGFLANAPVKFVADYVGSLEKIVPQIEGRLRFAIFQFMIDELKEGFLPQPELTVEQEAARDEKLITLRASAKRYKL